MKLKGMLKLVLSALLLAGGASAYAQVQLANGAGTKTWKEFADVINGTTTVTVTVDSTAAVKSAWKAYVSADSAQKVAKKAVDDQKKVVARWDSLYNQANDSLSILNDSVTNFEPKTAYQTYNDLGWFKTQESAYNVFYQYAISGSGTEPNISYSLSAGMTKVLYLSFTSEKPTLSSGTWTTVNAQKFHADMIESTTKFTSVKVFLGFAEGSTSDAPKYNYGNDGFMTVTGFSSADKESIYQNIETTFENKGKENASNVAVQTQAYKDILARQAAKKLWVQKLNTEKNNAQKVIDNTLQPALDAANTALATATTNWNTAKADFEQYKKDQQANALAPYQTVTLTADVEATTLITAADYTGTINGNGKVINITIPQGSTQTSLFNKFSGHLYNAAVNGTFAGSYSTAEFDNVAVWTGTSGRVYDESGSVTAYKDGDLGKFGFDIRDDFGANLVARKVVTKGTNNPYKVYNVTFYNDKTANQQYVNYVDSKFVNASYNGANALTIAANMFAKTATADLANVTNMIYDGTCNNVVITDKQQFFCPDDINAVAVTYARQFSKGYNSVCLPFELDYSVTDQIEAVCSYDRETADNIYFMKNGQSIAANTPCLMVAKNAFTLNLSNIAIKATPASQLVVDNGNSTDGGKCYGGFKGMNVQELGGVAAENRVYGLTTDGTFKWAGSGATIPAFRLAVLSTHGATPTSAPRRIIVVDEDGNDITEDLTGIKSVSADEASTYSVASGVGEIVITSENELGNVEIYTIDGKVAAVANVMAGTTTVNVAQGMYIVMGKKVIVK